MDTTSLEQTLWHNPVIKKALEFSRMRFMPEVMPPGSSGITIVR